VLIGSIDLGRAARRTAVGRRLRVTLQQARVARFFTTPEQLRAYADRLEGDWANASLGEDVPRIEFWEGDLGLQIVIDQEEMHRQERRKR
jgi:hypothetical protein